MNQSMTNDSARPSKLRQKAYDAFWVPPIRSFLVRLPLFRRIYDGWSRRHPFDVALGIDTSGSVPAAECAPDAETAAKISPYGGSQPSIVRAGLALLPDHAQYAFVDLGCGKGRPLAVASEFPFRRVSGIEFAPKLAEIARRNARVIAGRHPERTAIIVDVGDATLVVPPAPFVVYFMYHPFGRLLVRALAANIERQLGGQLQHAFLVYYNPVHGAVFDESARFSRWHAETVPYAPGELGYGPDIRDTFVIWQTVPGRYPARTGATRRIVVRESGSAGLDV